MMIDIPTIRAQTDLVALISPRVKLTRRGREYVGLCFFHQEKSASFCVIPHKQMWHCFGCGSHGDALDWVMRTEGVTLQQAAERLGGAPADPETARRLRREQAVRDKRRSVEYGRSLMLATFRDRNPDCNVPDWLIDLRDASPMTPPNPPPFGWTNEEIELIVQHSHGAVEL